MYLFLDVLNVEMLHIVLLNFSTNNHNTGNKNVCFLLGTLSNSLSKSLDPKVCYFVVAKPCHEFS